MRRGFFRIWIVVSICWVFLIAAFEGLERWHQEPSHVILVDPEHFSADAILLPLHLTDPVKAEAWLAYDSARSSDDLAAKLLKLPLTDSARAGLRSDYAAQIRFQKAMDVMALAAIAVVPPLLLYAFGFQVFPWVWRGFRKG